jgi:hypothetical protein
LVVMCQPHIYASVQHLLIRGLDYVIKLSLIKYFYKYKLGMRKMSMQ